MNRSDKCYWCFVREFIPLAEQEELSRQWNCTKTRLLSIAWLKDSLNKYNLIFLIYFFDFNNIFRFSLHFQFLAFTSKSCEKLKAKWYNKNACLRNKKILIKICENIQQLQNVEFFIEVFFY